MTVINVITDHSAVGDGITDDTAAVQAALDSFFDDRALMVAGPTTTW